MHFDSLRMLDLGTFSIIIENNCLTQVKALNKLYKLNKGRIVVKFEKNFLNTPLLSRMYIAGSVMFNFDEQM